MSGLTAVSHTWSACLSALVAALKTMRGFASSSTTRATDGTCRAALTTCPVPVLPRVHLGEAGSGLLVVQCPYQTPPGQWTRQWPV